MTEEKRKRGRPKKAALSLHGENGETKVFGSFVELREFLLEQKIKIDALENPDCEPATKGYVKSIARKLVSHRHEQCGFGLWYFFATVIGFLAWICAMVVRTEPIAAWAIGVGTLVSGACLAETIETSQYNTETSNIDASADTDYGYPDYIKKYEPPNCEKKNECE